MTTHQRYRSLSDAQLEDEWADALVQAFTAQSEPELAAATFRYCALELERVRRAARAARPPRRRQLAAGPVPSR